MGLVGQETWWMIGHLVVVQMDSVLSSELRGLVRTSCIRRPCCSSGHPNCEGLSIRS